MPAKPANPLVLLIDGVGGFLLCLGQQITLGQAAPDADVDIPIFADVSPHHATLTRDAEGYLLEGVRPVQVNAQVVDKALLHSGDRVTLGTSCQFHFRQPVPISASAVLELVSGQRLQLAVQAVLLMAEAIVLGPGPQVHVVLPEVAPPVVLFRHQQGLGIRCAGTVRINGPLCQGRGLIEPGATVTGDQFSLGLERVS